MTLLPSRHSEKGLSDEARQTPGSSWSTDRGGGGLGIRFGSIPPPAHAAGWQYQVGVYPDLGGNPSTHFYANLLYTTSGNLLNPSDTGNWYSYWTAGSDQNYSANWYQVGYGILQPGNPYGSPQHWAFIQTTASPGYIWCEAGWGFTVSNGANGQAQAGCSGNMDNLGVSLGNYYTFEIYTTNDCAYGPSGCIYGCNGNVRFAIAGHEIGHLADCSSTSGANGISASVLEPTDAYGTTPKDATPSQYSATEYMNYFHAIIFGGDYQPNFLSKYCAYSPPAAAGANIYSNVYARASTYSASCTGSAAPVQGGSVGAVVAPTPGLKPIPTPPPSASPTPSTGVSGRTYDPAKGNLPLLKPTNGTMTTGNPQVRPSATPVR